MDIMLHRSSPANAESDPMGDLRMAMENVRRMRETGVSGLALQNALYDQEARPINQEFLNGFFEALPVSLDSTGRDDRYSYGQVTTRDPAHIPAIRAFAVTIGEYWSEGFRPYIHQHLGVGFVIGERYEGKNTKNVHVLVGSQKAVKGVGGISCAVALVGRKEWDEKRELMLDHLSSNEPEAKIADKYNSPTDAYEVGNSDLLEMLEDCHRYVRRTWGPRHAQIVAASVLENRGIRMQDFEEFNVMTHLEVLSAAFGTEARFDQLKSDRAAALPPVPAELLDAATAGA